MSGATLLAAIVNSRIQKYLARTNEIGKELNQSFEFLNVSALSAKGQIEDFNNPDIVKDFVKSKL